MKDNISSKLAELGIPAEISQEFRTDIFGKTIGINKQPRLIDCLAPDKFNEKLLALTGEWKSHHPHGERFLNYFMKYKAELIKKTMTADFLSMSGLGFPPCVYNQNGNKCVSSALQREKAATGKKRLSLPAVSICLKKQYNDREWKRSWPYLALEI